MTETSYPWAGITTGDAGPYSDAEWQQLHRAALGFGTGYNDSHGVFWGSDTLDPANRGLDVLATNPVTATVNLRPGAALVDGSVYYSDAVINLAIAANASGNPRIDSVILRKDVAAQLVRAVVKQGTPAASPVAPALTQTSSLFEIPLADITVANGFATLAQSVIQPVASPRNGGDALYHFVKNNSGQTLKTGLTNRSPSQWGLLPFALCPFAELPRLQPRR